MEDVETIIISADGKPRNSALLELFPSATVLKGHDGRQSDYQIPSLIQQAANKLLFGKVFTPPQAAATMSHYLAQVNGSQDWTCLLEDDAVVSSHYQFQHVVQALKIFDTREPLLFLLHLGHRGSYKTPIRLSELFSILPVVSMPEGAVGYLVNRSMRELIKRQRVIIGPPDWPTWISYAKVSAIIPPVVSTNNSFTSIYMYDYRGQNIENQVKGKVNSRIYNRLSSYFLLFKPKKVALFGGYRIFTSTIIKSQLRKHLNYLVSSVRLKKLLRSLRVGSTSNKG